MHVHVKFKFVRERGPAGQLNTEEGGGFKHTVGQSVSHVTCVRDLRIGFSFSIAFQTSCTGLQPLCQMHLQTTMSGRTAALPPAPAARRAAQPTY